MDFAARQFTLRRLADKVERRLKRFAGKDDGAPWILDPPSRRRTTHVDFILALDYLSPNSRLLQCFHQAFAAYGMSVLLVNKKKPRPSHTRNRNRLASPLRLSRSLFAPRQPL